MRYRIIPMRGMIRWFLIRCLLLLLISILISKCGRFRRCRQTLICFRRSTNLYFNIAHFDNNGRQKKRLSLILPSEANTYTSSILQTSLTAGACFKLTATRSSPEPTTIDCVSSLAPAAIFFYQMSEIYYRLPVYI